MTSQEAFERNLALGGDSLALKGKLIFTSNVTTTPSALFSVQPSNLGARASGIAAFFTRFRVKYLRVKFMVTPSTIGVAGVAAMGFLDDISTIDVPTSVGGVSELRCSATNFGTETVPTFFEFRPLNSLKWLYLSSTTAELTDYATCWVASSFTGNIAVEVDYSIVLSGAADVAAT